MGNENKVESLDNNEVEKVTGGAYTSRDERGKKAIGDFVSKLPPRHKVKIFCCKCRKSYDWWMEPYSFGGILTCPKCGSRVVRIEHTDEFETKNGKATQTPTAPETKN